MKTSIYADFEKPFIFIDKLINLIFIHKKIYKQFNVLSSRIYVEFFYSKYNLFMFRQI